jgi:DNA-binding transcriptional ArsR family regulator
VKGFANHRRIQILELLKAEPELSLAEISETLKIQFKNASQHVSKLAIAGLVLKRSDGTNVRHKLTERAERIMKFLNELE